MGERNPGWWFTQVCAGVAAVTLIFAVGLGAWSLTADSVHVPSEVVKLGSYQDPVRLGWIAVAVSGTLLILLVAVTVLRSGLLAVAVVVGACVAAILVVGHLYDVITTLRMMTADIVRSPRFPAAATAWFLTAVGSVATVFGVVPFSPRRRTVSAPLVIAVVVALLGSTTAVWAAVRAGDDARFVDASRAQEVRTPPLPATFGPKSFTMKVSDRGEVESYRNGPGVLIAGAGAGFVVVGDGVLTAYDPEGKSRWHYRRTGPGDVAVERANVYDDGRTVVLYLGGVVDRRYGLPALVALDAMTGEQLWTSTDPDLVEAFGSEDDTNMWPTGWSSPTRYLVHRGEDRWRAYDPRTGAQLWDVPRPARCPGGEDFTSDVVEGASMILLLTQCAEGGSFAVTAATLDPRTGEMFGPIPVADGLTAPDNRGYVDTRLVPAGDGGAVFSVESASGEIRGLLSATGSVAFTDIGWTRVARNVGPAREFVAGTTVFGPDAVERCRFDVAPLSEPSHETDVVWLGEEFVLVVDADPSPDGFVAALQSFNRQTCAPVRTVELPWGSVHAMGPTPGSFLVLRTDEDDAYVDGYR